MNSSYLWGNRDFFSPSVLWFPLLDRWAMGLLSISLLRDCIEAVWNPTVLSDQKDFTAYYFDWIIRSFKIGWQHNFWKRFSCASINFVLQMQVALFICSGSTHWSCQSWGHCSNRASSLNEGRWKPDQTYHTLFICLCLNTNNNEGNPQNMKSHLEMITHNRALFAAFEFWLLCGRQRSGHYSDQLKRKRDRIRRRLDYFTYTECQEWTYLLIFGSWKNPSVHNEQKKTVLISHQFMNTIKWLFTPYWDTRQDSLLQKALEKLF